MTEEEKQRAKSEAQRRYREKYRAEINRQRRFAYQKQKVVERCEQYLPEEARSVVSDARILPPGETFVVIAENSWLAKTRIILYRLPQQAQQYWLVTCVYYDNRPIKTVQTFSTLEDAKAFLAERKIKHVIWFRDLCEDSDILV